MFYKILVVDDDPNIREVLSVLLRSEGYDVDLAENGLEAINKFQMGKNYDLLVLDIMMPEMNGYEVCQRVREFSTIPILFLTARSHEQDKSEAYYGGGDDYLVKPFSQQELLFKIRSLTRRYKEYNKRMPSFLAGSRAIELQNLEVNVEERSIRRGTKEINLTDKEFEILQYFLKKRGRVVSNKELYEGVWGETYVPGASNTIMVHILNLRRKIEEDINKPKIIKTVWGKGYKIE